MNKGKAKFKNLDEKKKEKVGKGNDKITTVLYKFLRYIYWT